MVVEEGLQLAAERADFILVQDDFPWQAFQLYGRRVRVRDCNMRLDLQFPDVASMIGTY
jgi:hypothetical protein